MPSRRGQNKFLVMAAGAICVQRRYCGGPLRQASQFYADHLQVENVLFGLRLPVGGLRLFAGHGEFGQEYLAKVGQIDHVTKWNSRCPVNPVDQRAFHGTVGLWPLMPTVLFIFCVPRPVGKIACAPDPAVLRGDAV